MQAKDLKEQLKEIENPANLSAQLGLSLNQQLTQDKISSEKVREFLLNSPYFHLKGVFSPDELPDTPLGFIPVPFAIGTIKAKVAILAIHGFLNLETISYGSENNGELFVNIVRIPGDTIFAEKSAKNLRGHTDGVSFPFNNEDDPQYPRVAPSPDIVSLVGLRNPQNIPTKIMPLDKALAKLSKSEIEELKKSQYLISSQRTFQEGMKSTIGQVLIINGGAVLKDVSENTYVRYSHSSVAAPDDVGPAKVASDNFESACEQVSVDLIINPGDICVINNRISLHGRGEVGDDCGGDSRWILRSYALDTSSLGAEKRHNQHVLYP